MNHKRKFIILCIVVVIMMACTINVDDPTATKSTSSPLRITVATNFTTNTTAPTIMLTSAIWSKYEKIGEGEEYDITECEVGNTGGLLLNFRTGAGLEYSILKGIYQGTKIKVIDKVGVWYRVNLNGTIGYIHSDYCH